MKLVSFSRHMRGHSVACVHLVILFQASSTPIWRTMVKFIQSNKQHNKRKGIYEHQEVF